MLDPRFAPRDQTAWAFTREADAEAVAAFLNEQLGGGGEIAWVEAVPLARKLNAKVLQYLDCWAEIAGEISLDD
jgi:hypothetical protein